MKNLKQWIDITSSSISCNPQQAKEMAIISMDAERSGGMAATWHTSSIYFGHKCNCQACGGYSNAGW